MDAEFTPYEDTDEAVRIFLEKFFGHESFDKHRSFASSENFGPKLKYDTIPEDWRVRYVPVLNGMRVYVTGSTSCPERPGRPGFGVHFSFCCEVSDDYYSGKSREPEFLTGEDCEELVETSLTVYPSESEPPIRVGLSLGKEYDGVPGRSYSEALDWLVSLYCFVYDTGKIAPNAWIPLKNWREGEFNKRLEGLSKRLRLTYLEQFPHAHGDWLSGPLPHLYYDDAEVNLLDQITALGELKAELESMLLNETPDAPPSETTE